MAIHEYTLPNADTRPRRVAIDPQDVLWYSDYARGYLGRFDPKTGSAMEWPSPGGPTSQPYAITYLKGAIWYVETAVKPNALVRFDSATPGTIAATVAVTGLQSGELLLGIDFRPAGSRRSPTSIGER